MKLFCLISATTALPNVHFFVRSNHPKVQFHEKRLETSFADIQRQIDEHGLSNRVKYDHLTSDISSLYHGKFFPW